MPSRFHTFTEEETGVVVRIIDSNYNSKTLTHDDYIDKVHKAEYVNLQVEFTESLTNLSLELKNITNVDPQI